MNTRIIFLLTVFAGLQTVNEVNAAGKKLHHRKPEPLDLTAVGAGMPPRHTSRPHRISEPMLSTSPEKSMRHYSSAPSFLASSEFPTLGAPSPAAKASPSRTPSPAGITSLISSPSSVSACAKSPRSILAEIESVYAESPSFDKWGGHCYRDHVALASFSALASRQARITGRFYTEDAARTSIELALERNKDDINAWLISKPIKSKQTDLALNTIDTETAIGEDVSGGLVRRGLTKVKVVIHYDRTTPCQYVIKTAYPTR